MNASPRGADPAGGSWSPRLALLVAATFFMEFLDGTVLTTAIPSIAADFAVPAADVNITMTAYLMTVAMGIPLSGWLAERLGARRVFCLAIAIFTAASLLCALSQDLTMLTLSRVLQGAGGAMMVPVGTLVVLRGTPKKELLRATAFLVWPGLLAPVLAPLVGGALTTYLSWHWIFLVNLPLGLAAFLAALRLVPSVRGDSTRRLDWLGLVLTTLGVGSLLVGLELGAAGTPGCRRPRHRGGLAVPGRRRGVDAADQHAAVQSVRLRRPDVPRDGDGRLRLPPDHQRRAVPAAADVPGRFRLGPAARRGDGVRRVRGQHRDQARHHAPDPAFRLQARTGVRVAGVRGHFRAVRAARRRHAGSR